MSQNYAQTSSALPGHANTPAGERRLLAALDAALARNSNGARGRGMRVTRVEQGFLEATELATRRADGYDGFRSQHARWRPAGAAPPGPRRPRPPRRGAETSFRLAAEVYDASRSNIASSKKRRVPKPLSMVQKSPPGAPVGSAKAKGVSFHASVVTQEFDGRGEAFVTL